MRGKLLFILVGLVATTFGAGCDISSEPLAALSRVHEPDEGDTLQVGETFRLEVDVETDGPAERLIVYFQARGAALPVEAFRLPVPIALQNGTGVLSTTIDTMLTLGALPVEDAHLYSLRVVPYVSGRREGTAQSVSVVVE